MNMSFRKKGKHFLSLLWCEVLNTVFAEVLTHFLSILKYVLCSIKIA